MHVDARIELRPSLAGIDENAWNEMTGSNDPFVEHSFLRALETSGSVGKGTGWLPLHVVLWEGDALVGALPLYLKSHSYGEYIFDFGWAQGAAQLGIRYYPKLVAAIPFTPATGVRFLCRDPERIATTTELLLRGVDEALTKTKASSAHLLFLSEHEHAQVLAHEQYLPRLSSQFHWDSQGDKTFDDYLSRFRAEARKQVRRERRKVSESGLIVRVVKGTELSDTDWLALDAFYRDTCYRKGGTAYLSEGFFPAIRASKSVERLVCVLAEDGKRVVAGTINFQKGKHLYGRYWGSLAEFDSLHFELCYYRLIEYAIEQGLTHFEAGAQGMHKIKRGFLPVVTYSAHRVIDPRLQRGVSDYVAREALMVHEEIRELAHQSPFHREEPLRP